MINANQTSRVFDIVGMKGPVDHEFPNRAAEFAQGLVIEGGLATDDGGLTHHERARPWAERLLIDGGAVALSNVTLQNNEADGDDRRARLAGSVADGRARRCGSTGGNSHGGAIYLAAGSLTLDDDQITGNVARGRHRWQRRHRGSGRYILHIRSVSILSRKSL